jgi:hypothetical protein
MSTKDVSRLLFQPRKHYAGGRLQQGRSLLDSDHNEGAALDADEWRRAVLDAVGPRGTPDEGFSLGQSLAPLGPEAPTDQTARLRSGDFLTGPRQVRIGEVAFVDVTAITVRAGTYYLGGMRLELDRPEEVMFQRDFLQMTAGDLAAGAPGNTALYYLEAWEQPVTAVEDEELLDRALGGPDTMVRMRRMRQVKLLQVDEGTSCADAFTELLFNLQVDELASFNCDTSELESNGRLQLTFLEGSTGDPCTPDPPAQYLGTENQALRVMLTDNGLHFVWAFDNAAPLYRVNLQGLMTATPDKAATLEVQLLTPARDAEHLPVADRVIELVPFGALIDGSTTPPSDAGPHFGIAAAEVGVFARVVGGLQQDGVTFTVDASEVIGDLQALITQWSSDHPFRERLNPGAANNDSRPMYARFWHMATGSTPVQIPTTSDLPGTNPLGDTGIIPLFRNQGRRGDFWVAALRPDTPERIVPFDLLSSDAGVPPHGPRHFFAPLAVLKSDFQQFDDFIGDLQVISAHDCRSRIRRLADGACTTFTVGDGLHTVGDFTSIQAAIDALPLAGGRISVLPGFYKQAFQIVGRTNVTVEGCGDATVVETPTGSTFPGVATIDSSDHVTIANLLFHAVEQPAVFVQPVATGHDASHDIVLTGLAAQAFVVTASGVAPGAGSTTSSGLIELHDVNQATLSGLLLQPARRPAVRIESVNGAADVMLTDSSALGTDDTTQAPTPAGDAALIIVRGMERVTIRRTSLQTFGQVGVFLGEPLNAATPPNTDITLSELTVVAGPHPAPLETQPTVDISSCVQVTLEDSDLRMTQADSEQAVVILQGDGVILRGNTIVAETGRGNPAWGGVQVRGESSNIEIRDNDISGGFGHGITLGSLLWGPDGLRKATGAGQVTQNTVGANVVTGDLQNGIPDGQGGTLSADDEGLINGIIIADNHISGFDTNGISSLVVLAFEAADDTHMLDIENIRIERNEITGNVLVPFEGVPIRSNFLPFPAANPALATNHTPLDLRALPWGGIVLAAANVSAVIAGNTIERNGNSATLPTNGIFIMAGTGIEIVQNKIAANGSVAATDSDGLDNTPAAGVRAGIAVMVAGSEFFNTNQILDFVTPDDPQQRPTFANSSALALRVYQNSVQQPEGRALHVVAVGSVAIDGNFFSSQGFTGSNTTNDAFAIGDAVYVQDLGAPWEQFDAHTILAGSGTNSFPPFTTPATAEAILVNNPISSPRRFVGFGGGVLFANNQVILDWDVKRDVPTTETTVQPPLSYFAVTILTLDHLNCVGNNFAIRLGKVPTPFNPPQPDPNGTDFTQLLTEPLLANAFLGGSTLQVSRNRFSETVRGTTLSLITGAELMNFTAFNIGTHHTFAYEWWDKADSQKDFFFTNNNTALFIKVGVDFADFRSNFHDQAKTFFHLLRMPNS